MGGAIAQLLARDHPEVASGIVLSGTAQHWQDPETRRTWRAMGALGLSLSVAPGPTWRRGLQRIGVPMNEHTVWLLSELMRHSARDLAEAGRELGRFDSRPWLRSIELPFAVVITTRDEAVPVPKQRALAEACRAEVFEAPIRHMEIVTKGAEYNPALLQALESLRTRVPQAA
jgi:3-oxoadipate enol-lactonase